MSTFGYTKQICICVTTTSKTREVAERKRMRFTIKLTTLFTVIGLFIGVTLSYFVYTSNIKILEKQIEDRLEEKAFHIMDKVDRMLFEKCADIKVLATDPVIVFKK